MHTIILVAAVFAVFTFLCLLRSGFASKYLLFACALSILGGYVGAVFGALFGVYIGHMAIPSHEIIKGPISLHSVSREALWTDADSHSGGDDRIFIWGRRSASGKLVYHFHVGISDNDFVPVEVPANGSVHIIEDPSLVGEGYWISTERVMDRSLPAASWALPFKGSPLNIRQEFHVPRGTVLGGFPANR